ncbi:MAG: pseudouridine synthase [Helicobacteraceae bacterium]|jgi:23S rRNA pseudouridine2605 synthase|nr:pseudouridine synthase [Helicobacteraceae bacterium]
MVRIDEKNGKNREKKTRVRLNKAIADRSGYSRREADRLILDGRVSIGENKAQTPAISVDEGEDIFIDGKPLGKKSDRFTAIVYNKPKGELVTRRDGFGRRLIFDALPERFAGFVSVGRLDYASEGLLILTDSSDMARTLEESRLERVYNVKVDGFIKPAAEKAMLEGIVSKEGAHPLSEVKEMEIAGFAGYRIDKNHSRFSKVKVALKEGKNREIRRFFAHFGLNVLDLKRVSFGEISLNALPMGKWRYFSGKEYAFARAFLNLDPHRA